MGMQSFDVVVVGGGPAGAITAYRLAKLGVRTALIDANAFPRIKACGGGIQARTLHDIPFELNHLFRGTMRRITVSLRLSDSHTRSYPDPLVYCVLRSEFDSYLFECAAAAGAIVYERSPLKALDLSENGPITVRLPNGSLKTRMVVGADGANSIVRAVLNDRRDYFWQVGVSCEIPREIVNARAFDPDCMIVDWGTLPSGYAWAFPKADTINIGAGGPVTIARQLKRYVMNFIENRQLLDARSLSTVSLLGHHLPTLTRRTTVSSKRVVLVGDAAGLVEPFTGDGIAFACRSARIAADHIYKALNSKIPDLTTYQSSLMAQVGSELFWGRKLVSLSVAFPALIFRLFKTNERVWRTFCRTLRGEDSFQRLTKDILGPFEYAWQAIDVLTRFRERRRLKPVTG
jgi:geranylgeranyl reductase family protein